MDRSISASSGQAASAWISANSSKGVKGMSADFKAWVVITGGGGEVELK
jgi:hypothetical protein